MMPKAVLILGEEDGELALAGGAHGVSYDRLRPRAELGLVGLHCATALASLCSVVAEMNGPMGAQE